MALQADKRSATRAWVCPTDEALAGFLSGHIDVALRPDISAHLATCTDCQRVAECMGLPIDAPQSSVESGRIGRYVLLEVVGMGALGIVYSAYDPALDRRVALKRLHHVPHGTEANSELLREAKLLARFAHPNIIPVYGVEEHQGDLLVAMELVEGTDLRTWLKSSSKTTWHDVLRVFLDAGRGLAAAHDANLVHRDFKPDNVMVSTSGSVRVTDFGLARPEPWAPLQNSERLTSPPRELMRTDRLVGTPAYLAPEVAAGFRADALSDQFSFCVSLFEGLFGHRPVPGSTSADAATTPEAPLTSEAKVPAWLIAALQRGLASSPSDRFPSMHALLAALQPPVSFPRRHPLLLAGMVALGCGLGALTFSMTRPHPCQPPVHMLQGIWDAQRITSVEQAFEGSTQPWASTLRRTVREDLDAYAQSWLSVYTESCVATQVRHTQSDTVMAQRLACLGHRLQELGALTSVLALGDDGVLEKASRAVGALVPLSECGELQMFAAQGIPPPSPSSLTYRSS